VNLIGQWLHTLQGYWSAMSAGEMPQLGVWAYVALALLVLVEGPIATLLGAFAASAGVMRPVWVFAAAATGNLTADTLWYSLGYMGKSEWLIRWGRFLHLRKGQILHLEEEVRKHALKLILVGKLTASLSIPALVATGLAKVPVRRWIGALLLGEMIWTGGLVIAGYKLGESLRQIEAVVQVIVVVAGAAALYFIARHIIRSVQQSASGPPAGDPGGAGA
jgi:membrane protein DedA with SNARE-associated domain